MVSQLLVRGLMGVGSDCNTATAEDSRAANKINDDESNHQSTREPAEPAGADLFPFFPLPFLESKYVL